MDDLLTQLPAMLGVVLGVVGTLVTTALTDAARWRREQGVRFDHRLLDACAEYSAAVRDFTHAVAGITADRRPWASTPPIDSEAGEKVLRSASRRQTLAWEMLCLLADDSTVEAGRRMWHAAIEQNSFINSLVIDRDDWDRNAMAVRSARDDFHNAARASMTVAQLGTTGSRYFPA
jgi:hypothetical protein